MTEERTDERVDQLLADLDRALAVEPSPAVAARVRTRLETASSGWAGWSWSLAAAGGVVLATAAYFAWPSTSVSRAPSASIASTAPVAPGVQSAAQIPSQVTAPLAAPAARQARARVVAPQPVRHTTVVVREPEVLVSPNQRIALDQLAAALTNGRLTIESAAAANQPIVHEPLIVPSVVITPFKADVLPPIGTSDTVGAGGGVIRKFASVVAAH